MGGTNFAIGGAKLDAHSDASSLRAQADLYLRKATRSGRTLHVVFGGGNDVLGAIGDPEASRAIGRAAESLRSIVADLLAHGTTDLLIPNLPDVSITPEVRARGSRAVVDAARLSQLFNEAAERALYQVAPAFRPGRKLYRLDVHAMAERARKDPAAFGFVEVSTPCNLLEAELRSAVQGSEPLFSPDREAGAERAGGRAPAGISFHARALVRDVRPRGPVLAPQRAAKESASVGEPVVVTVRARTGYGEALAAKADHVVSEVMGGIPPVPQTYPQPLRQIGVIARRRRGFVVVGERIHAKALNCAGFARRQNV